MNSKDEFAEVYLNLKTGLQALSCMTACFFCNPGIEANDRMVKAYCYLMSLIDSDIIKNLEKLEKLVA